MSFIANEELERRKEYNDNLYEVPEIIQKGTLVNDYVIVKRQMYLGATTRKSGIIEPAFIIGQTADGRPKPRFNDAEFAPMGVVMKVGDHENAKKYRVGDFVWLDHKALSRNHYDFLMDKENQVSTPEGYVRIPTTLIEFIESRLPQDPKESIVVDLHSNFIEDETNGLPTAR